MRFDTILIGGGLSSLVCGIKLQKAGRKCLMVSAGQNALHFSSGAFGLLGRLPDGTPVAEPLKVLFALPEEHPYSKIGTDKVAEYVASVPGFFRDCGIELHSVTPSGEISSEVGAAMVRNGYRMTPLGTLKPSWLAMKDVTLLESKDEFLGAKALIVNFAGFLDFNTRFIAEALEKRGTSCRIEAVRLKDIENIRRNPTEMRSVNIARVMSIEDNWKEFGHMVQDLYKDEDLVVLPEVFGLGGLEISRWLQEMIPAKVLFLGTMPPSVPGIKAQMLLKNAFESAGGTFLMGDTAIDPTIEGNTVKSIRTVNLGNIRLEAESFVLASGNLFGKGLDAAPDKVVEPVFGLDVDFPADRKDWCDQDFFSWQNFSGFGVITDSSFRAIKGGSIIDNLYVAGAELGGCNPLKEGSGAGIAILTAMSVADNILAI